MASDFKAEARLLPDLTLCLTSVEWQIARFAPQPSTPVNRQLSTVYSAQKCTYVVSVPKGGGRDNNANGGVGNVPHRPEMLIIGSVGICHVGNPLSADPWFIHGTAYVTRAKFLFPSFSSAANASFFSIG